MHLLSLTVVLVLVASGARAQDRFVWPDGKRAAVSLTFDDARPSQIDVGASLFERFDVKATFYVVPRSVEQRLDGWKRLVAEGHEIGNHSLNHPCTGNFAWSRDRALENYSMADMRSEMTEANSRLEELLGVRPVSFAYPCGQTFVGRGVDTRSYVPLVAQTFISGRGWLDEAPNDPTFADLAQLMGVEMDGKEFDAVRALVEKAKETGAWLVLAGHEIGTGGSQTTRVDMLERLLEYGSDPANDVWMAPVGTVGRYVAEKRRAADRVPR